MPERIQRRRTDGWRMPEGAIYVGRPTRWGNPYRVGTLDEVSGQVEALQFPMGAPRQEPSPLAGAVGSVVGAAIGGFGTHLAPLTPEEEALLEDRADWDAAPRW